jgi:hypothetical protein
VQLAERKVDAGRDYSRSKDGATRFSHCTPFFFFFLRVCEMMEEKKKKKGNSCLNSLQSCVCVCVKRGENGGRTCGG